MERYNYRAINQKGRPVRGTIAAANEADLFQQLQASGLELIDCKPISDKRFNFSLGKRKIQSRDLIQLFLHLEQLQKAGIPLLDGLADIRDTTDAMRLRDIMSEVHREVSEGSSLSQAMANHPTVFSNIFISMIAAGEETGNLTDSFQQIIRYLKWTDAMTSRVKKATRYPKVLVVVVAGVISIMMTKVVPDITSFLKNIDQELWAITEALVATSEFFVAYWPYILGTPIAIYVIIKLLISFSEEFAYRFDYMVLRTPMAGVLVRKISLSRFCQTFGALFLSGLEILKCIEAARQTCSNRVIREALGRAKEQVQEGSALSTALNNTGEFPSMVIRMIKIGEESGNLTGVLEQVTEFYDKDVNDAIDGMIQMIEPTLTVILGGMILWIAAAVFGPIYDSLGNMGI